MIHDLIMAAAGGATVPFARSPGFDYSSAYVSDYLVEIQLGPTGSVAIGGWYTTVPTYWISPALNAGEYEHFEVKYSNLSGAGPSFYTTGISTTWAQMPSTGCKIGQGEVALGTGYYCTFNMHVRNKYTMAEAVVAVTLEVYNL